MSTPPEEPCTNGAGVGWNPNPDSPRYGMKIARKMVGGVAARPRPEKLHTNRLGGGTRRGRYRFRAVVLGDTVRKSASYKLKVVPRDTRNHHERKRPRRNYARWRAISLSLVYLVFAAHIVHWKLTGKTLAPLELNEVMYTLELGIITAGFIFMCLLVIGTLLFGRFFCSWACHMMVLQDLCAWFLRKVGIRAKPFRSRLLLLVPPLTAFYMFVWPQILRAWHDKAVPTFHWATDRDGWASLITENFWRNLPGPWIIAITFIVCGLMTVYFLGSRTFCTYVCPYGAVFALADRFSPGRIKVSDACRQCGQCTAACTSGIRVHEEVNKHGMIVNPACMKDFDCISACPQQALRYGLGRPAFFKSLRSGGRFGLPYDFTLTEELVAASVFVVALLSFRGLYARVPFLLSLAIGVLLGFLTVQMVRMFTRVNVRVASIEMKRRGRIGVNGSVFSLLFAAMTLLVAHSGYIRYHEFTGLRGVKNLATLPGDSRAEAAKTAHHQLLTVARYGLFRNPNVQRALVFTSYELGRYDEALVRAGPVLTDSPDDTQVQLVVARSLLRTDRAAEARRAFEWITDRYAQVSALRDSVVAAQVELARLASIDGDFPETASHLREAVTLAPDRAELREQYGASLAELGRFDEAISQLARAVKLDPDLARAQYNLGTVLLHNGQPAEAVEHLRKALPSMGHDVELLNNLGSALSTLGQVAESRDYLRRAVELSPENPQAHFNLARTLLKLGDPTGARKQLQTAARLDPRYTEFLTP